MKVELELPDEVAEELQRQSTARRLSPEAYATEMIYQFLAAASLGENGSLENRPDWQAAIERSRSDLAAGRTRPHHEVEEWHRRHPG